MSRTLTLETTTPESTMNITIGIGQTQLILRSYRVDIDAATIPYKHLGLDIGTISGSNYIIDNQTSAHLFRIPLSGTILSTTILTTFVPNCYIPLTMSSNLDPQFVIRVRYLDRTVFPWVWKMVPAADLKYLSLTFEAL